jgi:hypothetical protein
MVRRTIYFERNSIQNIGFNRVISHGLLVIIGWAASTCE